MATRKTRLQLPESRGLELYQQAMRSRSLGVFLTRMRQASDAYSTAARSYKSKGLRGEELRCRAWNRLLGFFLASKAFDKKRLLDESWRLAKLAMAAFRRESNNYEFAATYDQLSTSVALGYDFHWKSTTRAAKLHEAIEYGRRAVAVLSAEQHRQLTTRIYVRVALFLDTQGETNFQYDQQSGLDQEALAYWRTAEKLDRKTALLQVAQPPPGFYRTLSDQEGGQICNEALKLAKRSGDNFAIGWQLDQAAARMYFEAFRHLDDAEKVKVSQKSLILAEEAQHRHSLTNFVTPNDGVIWAASPYVEHFRQLSWFQSDQSKRLALLEKSMNEAPLLIKLARRSGYPMINAYAQRMASGLLSEMSSWATDPSEKKRLLRRSTDQRARAARIIMLTMPNAIEPLSNSLRVQAELKAELADLEPDRRRRIALLQSAVTDKEKGVQLYRRYLDSVSKGQPHILHRIGGKNQLEYGDLLTRLYHVTKKESLLSKIAIAYSDAAITLKQGGATSGLGLAYWKAAEAYDLQQANVAAAEYFGLAAKTYSSIKDKNPEILSIFQDYSKYMEAWSNIEEARAAHKRLAHDEAESLYEKAADLHRTAGRWNIFASYYAALARLEKAESLSRAGDCLGAVDTFRDAAERFRESTASLQAGITSFSEAQEKSTIQSLITPYHEEYCRGRMLVEEARNAEDQGDYQTSAEKFNEAARTLASAAQSKSLKRDKNELLYISTLAKAWSEIAHSSASKDPAQGLGRACSYFEQSLDYCPDENAKNVSLGHKYFCQALAASDEFTYSINPNDYASASKNFSAASTYFAKAGFDLEATHVKACKLLLDAHSEAARSSKDDNVAGSTVGYGLAIELLEEAADAFAMSRQTAKQTQVLSLLRSVSKQHGFSKRLAIASRTVSRISPTVAFPTPARGEESPVGYSRFTGSAIDVDYGSSNVSEIPKNGEIALELRVANIGTKSIQILRIDNLVPTGTRITNASSNVEVQDTRIIPVRKSTAPMGVEKFQVRLKSGNNPIIIRPSIVYTDDSGREIFHNLPARVVAGSPILDYLAREFNTDFRRHNLAREHCGWRTLTTIVTALKIPRSHVYGEPRWGHAFGRPLDALLKSEIVECRTFPGERGRGGRILKARLAIETEVARRYLADSGAARIENPTSP